jgi:uncharacterized protein YcaQ
MALIERRLAQVERMLHRRIPDLAARIDAGELDEADVVDIEADAVLRVVRNPEGFYSEQDGSYSYRLATGAADNSLRILPEEWQKLGVRPSRAFTIVPRLRRGVRVPAQQGN